MKTREFILKLETLLFAPNANCLGCGDAHGCDGDWLCDKCKAKLSPLYAQAEKSVNLCAECGQVFKGGKCFSCGKNEPDTYTAVAAYSYEQPLVSLIHRFKYDSAFKTAEWMGGEMTKALDAAGICDFDIIVPVPLHKKRMLERGYNQSMVLAAEIGRRTGCEAKEVLVRNKNNAHQALLSAAERRKMQHIISAKQGLSGKKVLLVDDVRATGTTVAICTAALKDAGVDKVYIATFAASLKY